MNDHGLSAEHIRTLVDAVETPSIRDLERLIGRHGTPRHSRGVVVAAAVIVVIAALVGGIVLLARDDGPGHPSVRPADTAAPLPTSCVITDANADGCEVDASVASEHLGFQVRTPDGVPVTWEQQRGTLRLFRAPQPPTVLPPGVPSAAVYNQLWAPPGTDLDATGTCPTYLIVRERLAFAGEDNPLPGPTTVDLGNGRTASGSIAEQSTCGTGGPTFLSSTLYWVSDHISFTVVAHSLDAATVLRVAQSLG